MKRILPDIDLQHSIQKDRILEDRDFYKGKSFNFAGEWKSGVNYFNDQFITDFISYKGSLLACTKTHLSSSVTEPELIYGDDSIIIGVKSKYWEFVLAGGEGAKGQDAIQPRFEIETDSNGRKFLIQYLNTERTVIGELPSTTVRFANELPNDPENYIGQIVCVENDGDGDNDYLEYIAVRIGDANDYKWELIGGSGNISENDIVEIADNLIDQKIGNNFDNISTEINAINDSVKDINANIIDFNTRIDNLENSTSNAPLKDVHMNGQKLEFVYEINGEEKVIETDISDVIVNEEIGNGLANNDGTISVKVADNDQYLSVTDAGLSTTNLDSKFQSVDTSITNINKEIASIKEEVTQTENIDGGRFEWE